MYLGSSTAEGAIFVYLMTGGRRRVRLNDLLQPCIKLSGCDFDAPCLSRLPLVRRHDVCSGERQPPGRSEVLGSVPGFPACPKL